MHYAKKSEIFVRVSAKILKFLQSIFVHDQIFFLTKLSVSGAPFLVSITYTFIPEVGKFTFMLIHMSVKK